MKDAVLALYPEMDIVVKAAAVSDYRPADPSAQKVKKGNASMQLPLTQTEDILALLGKQKKNQVLVGFAAETERLMESAQKKLEEKKLDLLVANDVSQGVFGSDSSAVVVLSRSGEPVMLQKQSKLSIAATILDMALAIRNGTEEMKCGTAVIIGRPNSGKSTLLNAFVGQKISIVSPKPQTTRHRILGITTEARGQILFMDTPGIHKPAYSMNRRMLHTVYDGLRDVDLVLLVVDASISFGAGENFVLEMVKKAQAPAFLLLNKIDKIAKSALLPIMQRYGAACNFLEIIPISARTGENLGSGA